MTFRLFALCFLLLSCTHTAKTSRTPTNQDPRESLSVSELSFSDMAMANFVVREIFDGNADSCSMTQEQVFILPQQFKISMDQKFVQQKALYAKLKKTERIAFWPKDCAKNCSCSGYIQFAEYLESEGQSFSPSEKKVLSILQKQSETESQNQAFCIANTNWFCGSKIISEIKQNVAE